MAEAAEKKASDDAGRAARATKRAIDAEAYDMHVGGRGKRVGNVWESFGSRNGGQKWTGSLL